VRIAIIGTYTSGSSPVADGFVIYLFLPSSSLTWGISPTYNYSISYISTANWNRNYPSPVEGEVILPQSNSTYIVVQWDPYWQTVYTAANATGQWNVWVVTNPSGNNATVTPSTSPNHGYSYAGWGCIGTDKFQLKPGDWINVTVTYNPSTNTPTGIAYDLNTGQSVSFTPNLSGHFTPPSSGSYVFGIGAAICGDHANWASSYAAMTQQAPTPPSPAPPCSSTRRRTRSGNSGTWKLIRIDIDSLWG